LYLHAKAQNNVLSVLENISNESQVIFSTHSPYLIDANRLDRIRLVLKEEKKGTIIENKIQKGADKETLTPIITSIGLDLSSEFSIACKHNILLEGISDYFYLQAMKEYMPQEIIVDAQFIPCVGAQQIPQLVSLLLGWELDYFVILDNDREGISTSKKLKEKLAVKDNLITFVSDEKETCIEDLFTHKDFKKYILADGNDLSDNIKISKYVKKEGLDEVLIAKKFFEKVKKDKSKVELSQKAIDNFEIIFEKTNKAFST